MLEESERREEAELGVGAEDLRAPEDQAARFLDRGGEIGGEEVEDGGNFGGIEVGGEEIRARGGETGEVVVGEALGFEEIDGGEDLIDCVGGLELASWRVEDAEGFEVAKVLVMCSAEVDEGGGKTARSATASGGVGEGRNGGEWPRESSNRH